MEKKLLREGPYADFFSQGVQVGNVLTMAGQIAVDDNGNTPDDLKKSDDHVLREYFKNFRSFWRNS